MKSHAFTLVELLVSFSILLILLWLVPPAIVDFGETYQERVFIKQFENEGLNATREIPPSIYIYGTYTIGFKNETGNLTTYNKVPNITFRGKKYSYEYIFRFGGGRGYVKVSKN